MPEISPLGWFHTFLGAVALLSGAFALIRYKEISLQSRSSVIYLLATLVTAGTALAIYQHGRFGPGHVLAVATLAALTIGMIAGDENELSRLAGSVPHRAKPATTLDS